jgi:type VI secretion system secreted protein Hcp
MAIDAFMKLGTIKGESAVKGFEKQIDVLAWSWGVSNSGTMHQAKGGGAGKANVQDLSFTHYVDAATPNLMLGCCQGTHYPDATLTMRKAGGTQLVFLTIVLKNVLVSSYSIGGSGGEERLTANVTLNFSEFEVKYQPQNEKGAKEGGEITAMYDIAKVA